MSFNWKKVLSLVMALAMILSFVPTNFAHAEESETPVTYVAKVGDVQYESLTDALNNATAGDTITLLADATFSGQNAADKLSGYVIDLNDKTMTLSGNTYLTGDTTIKNGKIVVSGFVSDSYLCLYTADTKLTLDDVSLTGTMDCYAVLNGAAGSTLIIKNSAIDVVGNVTNPDTMGNIIYGGNVTVDNSTIKGVDTVRGIGFSNITIQNGSTVEISNVETGLNCATVTVDNSTVTITNATKRAVRLNNNALTLQNGAVLTATDCAEGIIGIGTTDTVSVSSDSTLNAVDNVTPAPAEPTGTLGKVYVQAANTNGNNTDRNRLYGEITGMANAKESLVIKVYSGNTLLATTTLAKSEYLSSTTLGVNIVISGSTSSSWNTVWEDGMPRADLVPDKAVLYIDGKEMNTASVTLNGIDDLGEPTVWENLPGVNPAPVYVAYIGETGYESLADAVAAAESGATINLKPGSHEMCVFQNKELTFVGEDKATTTITDYVAKGSQMHNVKVHFENLTVNGVTENYYGLFHSAEVTYKNCNINGLRFLYAANVSFEGCAFNANGVEHSFWTYGASNITVTNCTFTYTDRAVNCYSENGADHETDIAFTGCTFTYAGTADAPEGAVEINSSSVKSIDLTMDGCTAPAKGAMWFNSQWDGKKGANTTVVVDGEKVWPLVYVAYIGETGYESVAAALEAANAAGMKDVVITLCGDTTSATTDSVDLYSKFNNGQDFNTITFQQEDSSKAYYLYDLYTGWTTDKVVFDGVNITVTDQLYAIGNVELINNSVITRSNDFTNFVFYGNMTIEPGSKFVSQVDRISSGSVLTVDGGKTDGSFNTSADYKTVWLYVEAGNTMTVKNGAYVVASNWEYAEMDVSGTLNMQAAKLDVFTALKVNGVLNIDGKSEINTQNVSGTGKIVVDATGMQVGDTVGINANLDGFTGTIEVVNGNGLAAEIVDGKITLVNAPAIMVTYADGTVEYFGDMREAVPHTTNYPKLEGATITLLKDMSGLGMRFMENGMVFDLNGHTYTLTGGTGSQGTETSAFQIRPEVTETATIKNGTVQLAEGVNICWIFNCYATDFVVEDVTVDCANLNYAGYGESCYVVVSREGDNVQFTGTTKVINFKSDVAGAAINVGDTMTIGENVVPGGSIELDAGATLTGPEGLDVVTADGYKVVYENGVYKTVELVYVAQVGETKYESLQAAVEAVKDGETIVLLSDIEFNASNYVSSGNGYFEGIWYLGDQSFTIDLAGHTITCAAEMNDYVFNIKNLGAKANEITIKNGTITGGTAVWSVLCVGNSAETYPTTVNLEGVTVNAGTNSQWGDLAVKVRGASVVNLKSGTKIVGQSVTTYVVAAEGNAVLNVYDGAEITACAANAPAVSGNGTVNIYGGTVTATNGAFAVYTYSSGTPVVNISGGTVTGDIYAHADVANYPSAVATVNISGGTINGALVESYYGTPTGECSKISVSGGTFDQDPTAYVAEGYTVDKRNDGTYLVGKLPNAEVIDMGVTTIDEYTIYTGSLTEGTDPITLQIALDFLAKDTAEEAKANVFGEYTTDFYIEIEGLAGTTVTMDEDCYLAGNYGTFGWIMIPLNGMEIENGKIYPVITSVGFDFSYVDICTSVKDFKCGIHLSDAVMEANPDLTVSLTLGLSEDFETAQAANDFITVGEPFVYDVEDLAPKTYVAQVGDVKYETLAEAIEAANAGDEIKILAAGTYAVPTGKDLTITGAVEGVKFDMSKAVGMNASMTFNNVTFEYGNANYVGLQHAGDMVYNNCTFNGQVFLYGTSETFNNCTFNQISSDAYNVWTYGAKEVAFNECTFNSAGKSVLIYSEDKNLFNTVNVVDCDFIASAPVDGKAAIEMDSSLTAGINLTIDGETTVSGFGIGNVSGNSLWNNKKGSNTDANNDITVVVNGVTVLAPVSFVAYIGTTGYSDVLTAIKAAKSGETVTIKAGTYAVGDFNVPAGVTVVGESEVVLEGTLKGTLDNITLKNLHIKGGNAQRWAYAKGNCTFENVTFEATSVYALHFDGIAAGTNLLYKDCTIIGWAAMGGSPESCVFDGCTIKDNGTYGVIRTYFDTEIKNCTFDVDGANPNDVYQDGIHAVSGAEVTVNNCTNDNGDMADLVNVGGTSVIIVDGVVYRNVAKVDGSYYLTLAEAFAAAEDGDIVTLLTNIEMTESIKVAKKVTLDLNGKTISGTCGASQAYLFMVNNGATLTIKDGSAEQTGKITYAGNNSTGWIVDLEGALVLESGTLELTGTWSIGYAVDVRPNAWGTAYTAPTTFVMNGGKIVSSDGAVRVASSSSDTYNNITASFTMNGGEIEAAWDGIFVQQSNAAWDVLNVTINGGTIKSGLNPIRFYGPAATSYVNGEDCVAIVLNGGTLTYTGTETREWLIDGILRIGGGVTVAEVLADCVVTASADFAAKAVPAGYKWVAAENGMYTIAACDYVAEVGGTKYESLSAAIAAANAGDTVTLLADITEDVTVGKSLTIDGDNFQYTGQILTNSTKITLTVQNVNFVGGTGYAIKSNGASKLVVKNCTVKDYTYGFIYANKSTNIIEVTDVAIENCSYGVHFARGNKATLENVKMTNVTTGIYSQNYSAKTYTIKNSTITSIKIWDRSTGCVDAFKFEGVNTVDTLTTSQYAKFVGATVVGTNFYGDLVSMVNKAENGQTVKLLSNVTLDGSATVIESQFGYETLVYVDNKTITIDFAGFTAEVTPNAPNANGGIAGTIEAVIFVGNGANLTLKDSVGNGGIKVNAGSDLYSLIYNCESTLIIESGIYNVVETITAGSVIYADAPQTTTINGGTFTLGNASEDAESTKPWIINVEGKNDEFVVVNGGTYNQDLLMNYGSQKDCETHIPRTLALKDNGDGTWTIVDAVAYVGNGEYNNGYATFAEAYAVADEGETVTLLKPIVVNAGETLTLDKDVNIVYTSNVPGEDMITNRGTVNISAGMITYVNTDTTGSNVTVSTISCEPGSVLNVTGGTVENKTVYSTGSYAYAIDLVTNGNLGDVTAAISGGTVYSDYMSIRQFNNGTACKNTLTISGGYVYGAKRAVQIHLDNNAAYTTISGGKIEAGEGGYSLCFFPTDATNISVTGGEFIGTVYSGTDGFISGGTFDAEPYSGYIVEGYVAYEIGEGAWGIRVANYVAEVNGVKYESLQAAIDACVAGDNTITLLVDIDEDVTIKQVEGVNVTIDGAGKTYSGTITIHGNARYTGAETLTIKNVKFVTSEAGHYFIDSNSTGSVERYAHNVTVDNCYFVAKGDAVNSAVAMRIRQGFNISMTRCIVENLHSAFQGYGCAGFTAEGCKVTGKNGFSVGTSTNVKFVECAIDVTGYGIRADGTGAYDMTVQGGSIKAELPIVVRKATGAYKLTVDSKTVLEGTNENGYQVIFTNGDDGTYEYPTGKFEANIPDSIKVFPVPASAEIGHGLQTVVNASKPRTSVTFTLENVNAREELKVELWSGDTLLATTVLRDYDLDDTEKTSPFYPKKASTLTVNFVISGVESGSWNTVWNVTPGLSNIPDTIKVYADGELKDTYTKDGGVFLNSTELNEYIMLFAVAKVGDTYYASLDDVLAQDFSGEITVELLKDVSTDKCVDTAADTTYNFVTNVAGGVTMNWNYADNWNYIQKASIGANITLNVKYVCVWTDLDVYGTINTDYFYLNGGETNIHEGAVVNANTGDATTQVKNGTVLTVNGTLNTSTLNVWKSTAKLVVSGENAKVTASWIDIWDGTPSVVVENGATLDVTKMKASRGGSITVADATLISESIELGHNGESIGTMTVTGNSTVSGIKLTVVGSTVTGPEGLNVTTNLEGYVVAYENGVYKVVEKADPVAKIGETGYETLAEAIAAAQPGDTIVFLADITEDVTVNKSLTIDGANFKYTGNISVSGTSSAVTVKNVNFVDGTGYAITTNRIKSITVENCTVSNYGFGFLYANKSTPTVVVKDVTVDGGNYGFHWVYGTNATLENVTMTNVTYGLYIQNYASKTITLKDCAISSIAIWERDGYSGVQTFKFEGANTVGTLTDSQYAKYVLTATDATLTAPAGATVTTDVADYEVVYEDGAYKVVAVKKLFELAGANVKLGDSLDMFFYVNYADLDGTDYYAEIRRTYSDGTPDEVIKVPYSDWEHYNSSMIRVAYTGLSAKAMTDELYVTIYHNDGTAASYEHEDSIKAYAMRTLEKTTSAKLRTVLVDMLNYGAAAQDYFDDYGINDLANADLTAEQQAYATTSVSPVDNRVKGTNYAGSSVTLKSTIVLTMYFNNITTDMHAEITYVDHYGNNEKLTVEGKDFYKRGNMYGVDVTGLAVADGKQMVTCVVYDAEGNEVARAVDSIESYVARMSGAEPVYEMIMKFVTSAIAYFG